MSEREREIAELKARLVALENEGVRPAARPKPKAKSYLPILAGAAVAVVAALLIVMVLHQHSESAIAQYEADARQEANEALTRNQTWQYKNVNDPMTDKVTHIACVTSNEQVLLDPPYNPATADLCIRNSPRHGVDVLYRLNGNGQILCRSYDGCTVKVRYDQAAPVANGANKPEDNSTETVFLSAPRKVAAKLSQTEQTKIEVSFYQNGSQAVTFNTKGLDLKQLGI